MALILLVICYFIFTEWFVIYKFKVIFICVLSLEEQQKNFLCIFVEVLVEIEKIANVENKVFIWIEN